MTERPEDCLYGRAIFTANWRDDSGAFGTERIIRGARLTNLIRSVDWRLYYRRRPFTIGEVCIKP